MTQFGGFENRVAEIFKSAHDVKIGSYKASDMPEDRENF
jgi:hypothetical protein